MQRYRQRATGLKRSYFDLTDQFREGSLSSRLKEFVTYYAGRISYEEVEHLLVRSTGGKLLSDQKIQQLVVEKAAAASRMQQTKIARLLEAREMPAVRPTVDLYSAEASREVVLMEDGIQVKQQKAWRERRCGAAGQQRRSEEAMPPPPPMPPLKQKRNKRVTTDVAMLEKRDGSYEYLCGGIDDEGKALYDVVEALRAAVVEHYGSNAAATLAVVAITDGAQNIRTHLERVFGGSPIPVILDWYHLTKKVYQLLSMVAHGKDERERMQQKIVGFLWRGEVSKALSYLREVSARRVEALSELVTYLERHARRSSTTSVERRRGRPSAVVEWRRESIGQ